MAKGTDVAPNEVTKHLGGIDFPAGKQQMMDHAKQNGAPRDVVEEIRRMPDREYTSMADVMQGYGEIE